MSSVDRKLLAGGDADHLLDEVDAGDHLGHRMLDLQARVHFEKIEALVLARDELHRARRVVADRLPRATACSPIFFARRLVEKRRRRFFDDLLVAALN